MRKRYPLGRGGAFWAPGCGGTAWALARRSAEAAWIAGHGIRDSTRLQAADGDVLLSGPNLECEGVAAAADDTPSGG